MFLHIRALAKAFMYKHAYVQVRMYFALMDMMDQPQDQDLDLDLDLDLEDSEPE
jgi:hypothetical protein